MFLMKRFWNSAASLAIITLIILSSASTFLAHTEASLSSERVRATALAPVSSLNLTEWSVPTTGSGPWGITIDSFGKVWFTENATNKLARFDPFNNNFTEWSIPGGGSPRYLFASQISVGLTRVYFTEYASNKVGYLATNNSTFYEWQLPAGSNPVGIYVDENNDVWFAESGKDAIGRLTTGTGILTEWVLPGATSSPGVPSLKPWSLYVTVVPTLSGSNRFVWFTELSGNKIGRLESNSGRLALWDLYALGVIPGTNYAPMDLTVDSSNNVIFSNIYSNRISVLGNNGSVYREYNIPTPNAKPSWVRPDIARNAIWFTEYNAARIANANITYATNSFLPPTPSLFTLTPSVSSLLSPNVSVGLANSAVKNPSSTSAVSIFQGPLGGVTEYQLPNSTSSPNSIVLDGSGNIWFTESNTTVNRIARLSPFMPYQFQLSSYPNTQTIAQGQSATYAINVTLLGGAPLPVQLSLVGAPANLTVNFNPQTGTPPFTSTLTLSSMNTTRTETYMMNITATSGSQSKISSITLIVQPPSPPQPPPPFDFKINVTSAITVTIPQGSSASFSVQITVISGSSQEVNLTASVPSGTTHSFTSASGLPPFTSTLNVQTNMDTRAGSYPITITGTSKGGVTHSQFETTILEITELNRDFNLTTAASEVSLVQASRTEIVLTVNSIGPFNDNVTLNGTFSPPEPGLLVAFSPSSLTPPPNGGTVQATLEIVATKDTPGQTYQLTVTGTSQRPSRTHQITLTVSVSPCLIATAAFGSELAPEVQFLRAFRDRQVLHTFAGSSFMAAFNAWYYSFSPTVAQYEYSHATARTVIRGALYPLVGILQLASSSYAMLSFQPELAALLAGIVASFLIGLVYTAPLLSGLLLITRRSICARNQRKVMRLIGALFLAFIATFIVAEISRISSLMMTASTGLVLTVLVAGCVLGAFRVSSFHHRLS